MPKVTQPVSSKPGLKLEQCALESEHLRSRLGCLSLPLVSCFIFQVTKVTCSLEEKNSESTKQEVRGFPSGSVVKNPPAIQEPQEPWVRRSPGGHGDPLQNPTDRAAWQATVHRVAESNRTEAT